MPCSYSYHQVPWHLKLISAYLEEDIFCFLQSVAAQNRRVCLAVFFFFFFFFYKKTFYWHQISKEWLSSSSTLLYTSSMLCYRDVRQKICLVWTDRQTDRQTSAWVNIFMTMLECVRGSSKMLRANQLKQVGAKRVRSSSVCLSVCLFAGRWMHD